MWRGINRKIIPLADDLYTSEYQKNTRMVQKGELQRRWGYLTTGIAKQTGVIYNFATGNIHGNIHTVFNTGDGTTTGGGNAVGVGPQIPPPQKPPKKPKIPIRPDDCVEWGPFASTGTIDDVSDFVIPLRGCAGRVIVSGFEDMGRRIGGSYGYRFVVFVNGVNIFISNNLVNDSEFVLFPKGGTDVRVVIYGGVEGGINPGTWDVAVGMQ